MSEKRIEKSIQGYLDSLGAYHIKTHGNMFSKAGTPDILACVKGYFVAIEVKRPGGVVSRLQEINIDLINKTGGYALVAYSVTEVERYLQRHNLV